MFVVWRLGWLAEAHEIWVSVMWQVFSNFSSFFSHPSFQFYIGPIYLASSQFLYILSHFLSPFFWFIFILSVYIFPSPIRASFLFFKACFFKFYLSPEPLSLLPRPSITTLSYPLPFNSTPLISSLPPFRLYFDIEYNSFFCRLNGSTIILNQLFSF